MKKILYIVSILVLLVIGDLAFYRGGYNLGLTAGKTLGRDDLIRQQQLNEIARTSQDQRAAFTRDNILIRFNEQRIKAGLKELPESLQVDKVSQQRAEDIVAGKTPYGHDGLRELAATNKTVASWGTGEIINANQPTATKIVSSWMESPTHKEIILSKDICDLGIGIADGGSYHPMIVINVTRICVP